MNKLKEITLPVSESTIESIDTALLEWVKALNIHTMTNKGWNKIPVRWVSAERSFLSKENPDIIDKEGTLKYPIISIERKGFDKSLSKKGSVFAGLVAVKDAKGGIDSIVIARRINQDKTSNFANASAKRNTGQINFPTKNQKIVYETVHIPIPVYIDVTYEIKMISNFQTQMNDFLQVFTNKTEGLNYFILKNNNLRYEGFIQENFAHNNNISEMGEEERTFETTITVKVLGYLIGKGKNEEQPKIVIRENAVDIKFPRERIIVGDIANFETNQSYIGIGGIGSVIADGGGANTNAYTRWGQFIVGSSPYRK